MTRSISFRTLWIASLTLLFCSSIVNAQEGATTVVGNLSLPLRQSESVATPTGVMSVEKNIGKTNAAKKSTSSTIQLARPGERVINPDHLILNSDTTLGGVEVSGTHPNDVGYAGPGDMRTHLWNGHSNELIEHGINEHKLMAMTVPQVQKWHNYFHGVEDSPDHPHGDGEQSHINTIVQQPTMYSSPTYVENPAYGTPVYEDFGYNKSGYPQFVYGEGGIIYQQDAISQTATLR